MWDFGDNLGVLKCKFSNYSSLVKSEMRRPLPLKRSQEEGVYHVAPGEHQDLSESYSEGTVGRSLDCSLQVEDWAGCGVQAWDWLV